jgi:hypothetical protein
VRTPYEVTARFIEHLLANSPEPVGYCPSVHWQDRNRPSTNDSCSCTRKRRDEQPLNPESQE